MNAIQQKLINDIESHVGDHTPTLVPHHLYNGKFQANLFYFDDHRDLMLTVSAITYLAMKATNPDFGVDAPMKRNEKEFICQALLIVTRLVPTGDMALMDCVNRYQREEQSMEEEQGE